MEADISIWRKPGHFYFALTLSISLCRCKVRMSGLCKVEMSAFMDGRGPHGNGANRVEPTRTGPIESVARGTAEAADAADSRGAAESKRPQAAGPVGAEHSGAPAPALCGFRTHAGRRTLGRGRVCGEPGDATEVDDQGGLVAATLPAREKDPRMAGAQSQLR